MNDLNAIQNKNAVNLEMQQARLTKAKTNAENGNLGVNILQLIVQQQLQKQYLVVAFLLNRIKDFPVLVRSGSFNLPDYVEKIQKDKSALDKNRKGWVAALLGTVDKSQEKTANNLSPHF
jgi:hypothetical protein